MHKGRCLWWSWYWPMQASSCREHNYARTKADHCTLKSITKGPSTLVRDSYDVPRCLLKSMIMWTVARRVCVLWLQRTNSHGLQKSCGEKGTACPLSKWERGVRCANSLPIGFPNQGLGYIHHTTRIGSLFHDSLWFFLGEHDILQDLYPISLPVSFTLKEFAI